MLQCFGQRKDSVFTHRIRPLIRAAAVLEAGDRSGVDDMPFFPVLQDGGHKVSDTVDDAPDVHADDEFPIFAWHVDEFGAVHRHAGIVAGDMELAEVALGFHQSVEHRLLLRDIDPHRHDPLVRTGEAMSRLLDRILLYIGHDDVRTRLCKCGRNSEAYAGSSAGNDGGLAGDVHCDAFRWFNESSGRNR